jgi:Mg-chelatase subunit ChlI
MPPPVFPFSAIVGQPAMKTALLLNAVDPQVGGVLISGHKGTGKSTAVRALARILPPIEQVASCSQRCDPALPERLCASCAERAARGEALGASQRPMPYVELPLSATEDRLVGTLHVERALQGGERLFEPGLLAAAHRGILYVDEVNLLDDHLVDMLLDAAASGVNVVEREGLSLSHPARFLLVGTMNPEEGDLRPQFLDRFALCVSVTGVEQTAERVELVRRATAFERDPDEFCARWQQEQSRLTQQLAASRAALATTQVSDEVVELSVQLAAGSGARGHRAELAMVRAARALAAWTGAPEVLASHVGEVARYVLPHRMPDARLSGAETLESRVADLLQQVGLRQADCAPDDEDDLEGMLIPGATAAGSIPYSILKKAP